MCERLHARRIFTHRKTRLDNVLHQIFVLCGICLIQTSAHNGYRFPADFERRAQPDAVDAACHTADNRDADLRKCAGNPVRGGKAVLAVVSRPYHCNAELLVPLRNCSECVEHLHRAADFAKRMRKVLVLSGQNSYPEPLAVGLYLLRLVESLVAQRKLCRRRNLAYSGIILTRRLVHRLNAAEIILEQIGVLVRHTLLAGQP